MSDSERDYRKRIRTARIGAFLASRASRDTGFVDRLCRRLLNRLTRADETKDFMRDELIETDLGFDPDELDRYQRGELR